MNLKLILIGVVLLCATLEAKKRGDSKKNALKLKNGSKNGKSGRPRTRSSRMSRGSVQGLIDSAEPTLIKCQFLERNYGEGAAGILIRKCKVKRPYKKKVALTCEFGDFLCARCEAAKCDSFNKNKKVFLYQLAKKIVAGIKKDPRTKEFYCSEKEVKHEEASCRLSFPFATTSNFNFQQTKPTTKIHTSAPTELTTTEAATTTTTTTTVHPNCENDPNQAFCNSFMSWGSFIFNSPFENQ